MKNLSSAANFLLLQDENIFSFIDGAITTLEPWTRGAPIDSGLEQDVLANHYFNCRLWREEDMVRRPNAADVDIVVNKRNIDRFNQQRNDAVERIDDGFLAALAKCSQRKATPPDGARTARLNSETAGMMLDRLSILSLKIHHMAMEAKRKDVEAAHRILCGERTSQLVCQRQDLASCLTQLMQDCVAGRAYFKIYRQFKMYNDPRYVKNIQE